MGKVLKQKQITKEVNKALTNGFSINTESDEEFLKNSNFSWDDLNTLKDELGKNILEFVVNVTSIINNKEIINNLNDKRDYFNKLVALFFSDINDFSNKIKSLREQHEHLTGHINNINDFNIYNRIAINYQALFSELATLITPIISDIILTVSELVVEQNTKDSLTKEKENAE